MLGLGRTLGVHNRKFTFMAGLLLAVAGLAGSFSVGVSKVGATNCTGNDIIKCGFTTPAEFIKDVRANSDNGHHDLPAIYSHYGLSVADYDNFAANALPGKAMRDGTVVLDDGTVVATGGQSIGRTQSSFNPTKYPINGVNYYGGTNAQTFGDGVNSIPVYILFDASGTMKFAVMKACGNPEFGTPKLSSASCDVLNKTPVAGKLNTYSFTASANAKGNAKITKYVYNFGDGTPTVTKTNGTDAVQHTYTGSGTYTATVTVFTSVPGNPNLQLPAVSMCAKKVYVVACVQLSGAALDQKRMSFTFTVTAKYGAGATFNGADFDFGDGHSQNGVQPGSGATTATVTHTYATPATYNAHAVLHFTVDGQPVTAGGCAAVVTPTKPPTPECKPGVPEGSPECLPPCQPGSSVPPESPQCTPPELPKTGAGNTIAIFAVVVIGGFLIYRQLLFRKHKAAFIAAEQGTSPLPLADPLNQDNPLAGTPYATRKHSLRRKRPF